MVFSERCKKGLVLPHSQSLVIVYRLDHCLHASHIAIGISVPRFCPSFWVPPGDVKTPKTRPKRL